MIEATHSLTYLICKPLKGLATAREFHGLENLLGTTQNIELLLGKDHDALWDFVPRGKDGKGSGTMRTAKKTPRCRPSENAKERIDSGWHSRESRIDDWAVAYPVR